jgi:hypothetical protein
MQFIAHIASDGRWPTCTLLITLLHRVTSCDVCMLADRHCCSMEMDTGAVDERKEGGNAALLTANEHCNDSLSDFPLQINHGQLHISG